MDALLRRTTDYMTIPCGISIPQTFDKSPINLQLIRAFAPRAEALGYHSLWVQEQMIGDTPMLEPITLLTYVAALTSRVRVGGVADCDPQSRGTSQDSSHAGSARPRKVDPRRRYRRPGHTARDFRRAPRTTTAPLRGRTSSLKGALDPAEGIGERRILEV